MSRRKEGTAAEYYVYHNPNPAHARVGDCAVRALSIALGKDWESTYVELALWGFLMADMPSSNNVWGKYLMRYGFRRYPVDCEHDGCTVEQFCMEHMTGTYVLALGGHVVTVVNGQYMDTWDCGGEEVYYYWKKEE
ncbi:MAG: hypothetical protein IJ334_05970 [Clostridia bacterium]|nr:hypothetical protein [Clostridia bacterium]